MNIKSDEALWGSHIPALMACLADSSQPVIEFGIGHFSTPLLHAVCITQSRKLYSLEKDPAWLGPFAEQFALPLHEFRLGEYLDQIPNISEDFGVAFIDHSPGGQSRADIFSAMINRSSFVVVHDYHLDNEDAIKPLLAGLQTHVTRTYGPPTLVASAKHRLPLGIFVL